jgi:hypothetical protein
MYVGASNKLPTDIELCHSIVGPIDSIEQDIDTTIEPIVLKEEIHKKAPPGAFKRVDLFRRITLCRDVLCVNWIILAYLIS